MWKNNIFCIAIFTLLISNIQAQNYEVNFNSGKVVFPENVKDFQSLMQINPDEITDGKFYKFVQFYEIPSQESFMKMELMGFEFLEYIPNKVYLMAIPVDFDFSSFSALGIRSIISIEQKHKIDIRLEERPLPVWATSGNKIFIQLSFFKNTDFNRAILTLNKAGFNVTESNSYGKTAVIVASEAQINQIARLNFVRYLSLPSEPGTPESDHGRNLHRANMINRDYSSSYAFDGTGVNVCINDDGFAGPHIDFEGRTSQSTVVNDLTGNHGDGCAGIVGAAGNLNPLNRAEPPVTRF
jgi:subtilisin family serine protease